MELKLCRKKNRICLTFTFDADSLVSSQSVKTVEMVSSTNVLSDQPTNPPHCDTYMPTTNYICCDINSLSTDIYMFMLSFFFFQKQQMDRCLRCLDNELSKCVTFFLILIRWCVGNRFSSKKFGNSTNVIFQENSSENRSYVPCKFWMSRFLKLSQNNTLKPKGQLCKN